ncbi:hypothetical protein [Pseudoduganella sp. UC29_71]|uniref:hypothetical protein n=1 Tax=Pseudoduganella sp. UC29_71 TaxID=3350174 RepID=UPI00366F155A
MPNLPSARRALTITGALCALLLAGCANLGAIQEFAKTSADSAAYTKLTDEYINSPDTSKRYTLESEAEKRAALDALALQRKPQAARLLLMHQALASYMTTLGELAADDLPEADTELDGMFDAAAKANYIDESTGAPLRSLTKVLAEAALNGYRQRELNKVIAAANAPLQQLIAHQLTIMEGYRESLAVERAMQVSHQRVLSAMAREKASEPVAAELIWERSKLTAAQFAQREQALPKYVDTLKQIAAGHQALYDNRDQLSSKEVAAQIKRYTKRIRAAFKAARTPADDAAASAAKP